jgi:hypothetical protein
VRRNRPRITLTIPELVIALGLLTYGIGALGFAVFGAGFFFWLFILSVAASPFVALVLRRRRRQIARRRAARRRVRVSAYTDPWLEWEEAA